ncbi:helix-turn-helix domain-containing protein [Kozakia baliensis]|uniref:hypothetical protein n=1 Tax=Kozakia baliensis TaxID=153496 RepID=UPI001362E792|nr:hypothetical protein [Kozakia baliensis]
MIRKPVTREEMHKAFKLWKDGVSLASIAERFGIAQNTARKILYTFPEYKNRKKHA